MDNEQTPAQSENPAQAQTPAAPEGDGFQKRIDQLTAKIHEHNTQIMEFQQKLLEQAMRPAAPTPVAPQPEVDPLAQFGGQLDDTVARAVKAATEAVAKRFESKLAEVNQHYVSELSALQVHQAASSVGIEIPESVRAKATQIARQHGTSADIALKLAYGEFQLEQAKRVKSVQGYTPPSTPVLTGGAPAPQPRAGGQARPANFNDLNPIEQARWLEANGFDDTPIL